MKQIHKSTRGFTLIELSIVLIIIGLLLGAAIKGKDLIRSAQMKKFYNTAVKQWEILFNNFNDATGLTLGGPAVVKKSSTIMAYNEYVGQCGVDKATNGTINGCRVTPKALKQSSTSTEATDFLIRSQDFYAVTGGEDTAKEYIEAAGLELPAGQGSYFNAYPVNSELGKTMVYVLAGADFLSDNATAKLCWNDNCTSTEDIGSSSESNTDDRTGNFMLLVNLPYDVAVAVDKIIDGEADGQQGSFRCVKAYDTVVPVENFIDSNKTVDKIVNATKVKSIEDSINCGGLFKWNDTNKKYVTALYELTM